MANVKDLIDAINAEHDTIAGKLDTIASLVISLKAQSAIGNGIAESDLDPVLKLIQSTQADLTSKEDAISPPVSS